MQPLFGQKLVIASHNPGKVRELRAILNTFDIEVLGAADMDLEEPAEDGDSFEENARIKAMYACNGTGLAALSDDSGLVVPALNGAPGIYSARWAGPEKNYQRAMTLIEEQLGSKAKNAHFTCALALAFPSGSCVTFVGQVFGLLTFPPRGTNGFGYDPIFKPQGFSNTFGEMDPHKKHTMSHRAMAFAKLRDKFLSTPSLPQYG